MLELFKEQADWPYFSHLYTDGGKYTQGRGGGGEEELYTDADRYTCGIEELYTDVDKYPRGIEGLYTEMDKYPRGIEELYTDVDKYTRRERRVIH